MLIQDFEREATALLDVLGFVDIAHPAAAEQASDAIRAERLAGCEPRPGLRRVGRHAERRQRRRFVGGQLRQGPGCGRQQARRAQAFGGVRVAPQRGQ